MLESYEIRAEARRALTGEWNNCAVIMLVYILLQVGVSAIPVIGWIGSFFITGPLSLGIAATYIRLVRGEVFGIETLFKGIDDYMRSFTAGLLVMLYTMLWSFLLIVPGIIAALSYSMTFFIMNDDPHISAQDAITRSKAMMMGHKARLFVLMLSFWGWFFLGILGWGIPFFWISAYYSTSLAVFYQDLKGEAKEEVTGFVTTMP